MRKLFPILLLVLAVFSLASCKNEPKAHEHSWGTGEVVIAASCTAKGIRVYTCSCGVTKVESIAATGHSYDAGTDDGNGKLVHKCTGCDASYSEYKAYTIGATGPGGGIIFYDCDADNGNGNADGLSSDTCGWRFLEATPYDLRFVDGSPVISSDDTSTLYFYGHYRPFDDGAGLYVNDTETYNAANCTGTAIGTGKVNTEKLVEKMGNAAYTVGNGSGKSALYASKLCTDLTYGTKDDWFLPSKDELNLMYVNRVAIANFDSKIYWSSSEASTDSSEIWAQDFSNGDQEEISRTYGYDMNRRVRPIRSF